MSRDGVICYSHFILILYTKDYSKQLLITCYKNRICSKCNISYNDVSVSTDLKQPLCDLKNTLTILLKADRHLVEFACACREASIKPIIELFWVSLLYVNIF